MKLKLPKYVKTVIVATALAIIGTVYTEQTFITFLLGWVILIPIITCAYLIYGLVEYRKEHKNSIVVSVKSKDLRNRYADIIRKEEEIRMAKEVLYKELTNGKKGI
jgi:uncharacterized membrane protein